VYETISGWKTSLRECKTYDSLHANARLLVELVEKIVGVPVTMVGTGPERDDCVTRA
jgi:adenylosuccinate synthase